MLKGIENALFYLSAICIIAICALVFGNVIARAVFSTQIPDTIVIVPELMIAMILFPLAVATRERNHIFVELFAKMMPRAVQGWLVVLASVIGLLAFSILFCAGLLELTEIWHRKATFDGTFILPKWPGHLLYVVGLGFMILRLAIMIALDTTSCLRGQLDVLLESREDEESPAGVEGKAR
jgi:TRAP-type C4-dicarboxylate transport system permease small subunit